MKVSAVVKSIKQAESIKDLVSAFILPIDDLSINYENTFSISEIKKIVKMKDTFVVVNKNIHNSELGYLEEVLLKLEKLNLEGIIFYDIAVVNLKNKLKLKTPLVWAQEHLTTNYKMINYWYDKGAEYAYLSSELTKAEMDEIVKNSKAKIFVNVFGYLPMFTSRRNLVNNYIDSFSLDNSDGVKKLFKEDKYYLITDTSIGTTVYSNYILNALDENFSNYDYIVFNSNFISDDDFYDVLVNFKKGKTDYKFPFEKGFLYKETVYKVKKNG